MRAGVRTDQTAGVFARKEVQSGYGVAGAALRGRDHTCKHQRLEQLEARRFRSEQVLWAGSSFSQNSLAFVGRH
jgi:hypothetical protein